MSEAGDWAGRAGARHLHVVFLLQVDHLDPAQAADVGVLLVEVLGEVLVSAVKRSIGYTTGCTIMEKAPTRAFSWLKVPTSAFIFKTLLRHYAKRALTPRSLNVKLGPRRKVHKGRAVWLA